MYYKTIYEFYEYVEAKLEDAREIINKLPEDDGEILADAIDGLAFNYMTSESVLKDLENATIKVVGEETYFEILKEIVSAENKGAINEQETGEDC